MELLNVKDEKDDLIINSDKESFKQNLPDKNNINNAIITKKKIRFKDIPYLIYPLMLVFLILIVYIIILISFSIKYKVTYNYEENIYDKPKYSSHKYSSITFENGLKLVLVQVDSDDDAGGSITFDYGYLDNKYDPGYIKLAFLSLIPNNLTKVDPYINYFGKFNWAIEKFYSSFYFQIMSGGFQKYLEFLSELTYLNESDGRFDQIQDKDLNPTNNFEERKNHLLEYLVYGYKNNNEDILPQGNNDIKKDMNYTAVKDIMKMILSDPSKIKIVLYSHYKMSWMEKYFFKYFPNIINKLKKSDNNQNNNNKINAYDLGEFTTNKIIYYKLNDLENSFMEINYFLSNDNIEYNQLIKDSQYLTYIIYILNQTDEGSLYYELNNNENQDISIKSLSSNFEVVLKSKIKFSILINFNHYSYKNINEIILKVYNYMNNIKLYINSLDNNFNDIRIDELDRINEQNFTFTEDAHESIFYKNMAKDLFYKDEKDYLLKQMCFTKSNFIENITRVKYYYNQLKKENSVILLGLSDLIKNKYNLENSDISYVFLNLGQTTKYFNLTYSEHKITDYIIQKYDNNYSKLSNPKKNEFLSQYNSNSNLEYNESDVNATHQEISINSDKYLKVFLRKDTSFHMPKVVTSIYFLHPYLRPNLDNNSQPLKNEKLYYDILLYFAYIRRSIIEKLSDAFRAGNYFYTKFNENTFYFDLFVFSDIVDKCLIIINDILNNQNEFYKTLKNKFEIYRDFVLEDLLKSGSYSDSDITRFAFTKKVTEDKANNFPSIYNFCEFPISSFINYNFDDILETKEKEIGKEINSTFYAIKHIYMYGYFNESNASEIYKLFKSENNFDIPLKLAKYDVNKINVQNFVTKILERNKFKDMGEVECNIKSSGAYRFMYFSKYSLKDSCLVDMLVNILKNDANFINTGVTISTLKKTNIYLIYHLKDKSIENSELIYNIFNCLNNNAEMTKTIDVIGDKFYYLLKGYKQITRLKHYNIYDSAWSWAYDLLYGSYNTNDNLKFNMNDYKVFIDYMKELIKINEPYIDLYSKNNI